MVVQAQHQHFLEFLPHILVAVVVVLDQLEQLVQVDLELVQTVDHIMPQLLQPQITILVVAVVEVVETLVQVLLVVLES
jgi:hypothetical protein